MDLPQVFIDRSRRYLTDEHFSMHTGQIILVTKMRTGRDLGFYELQDGIPQPRWHKPEAGQEAKTTGRGRPLLCELPRTGGGRPS